MPFVPTAHTCTASRTCVCEARASNGVIKRRRTIVRAVHVGGECTKGQNPRMLCVGLALARFQVGLAVLLLNTLKWYKIRHGQLRPMTLRSAA